MWVPLLMGSLVVLLLSLEQGAFVSVGSPRSVRWQIFLQRLAFQQFQYMDRLVFQMLFWKNLLKRIYMQLLWFLPNFIIFRRLCHRQRQCFCLCRRLLKLPLAARPLLWVRGWGLLRKLSQGLVQGLPGLFGFSLGFLHGSG